MTGSDAILDRIERLEREVAAQRRRAGAWRLAAVGAVLWLGASSDAGDLNGRYAATGSSLTPADHDLALALTTRGKIGSALLAAGGVGLAAGVALYFSPSGSLSLRGEF